MAAIREAWEGRQPGRGIPPLSLCSTHSYLESDYKLIVKLIDLGLGGFVHVPERRVHASTARTEGAPRSLPHKDKCELS